MKKRNFNFLVVTVAALVLMVTVLGFSMTAQAEAAVKSRANLRITPTAGQPKDNLTIYGTGFSPGEEIKILLETEYVTLQFGAKGTGGIVKTDKNGAFVFKRVFPRGVDPGVYKLLAKGNMGSQASCQIEIKVKKKK